MRHPRDAVLRKRSASSVGSFSRLYPDSSGHRRLVSSRATYERKVQGRFKARNAERHGTGQHPWASARKEAAHSITLRESVGTAGAVLPRACSRATKKRDGERAPLMLNYPNRSIWAGLGASMSRTGADGEEASAGGGWLCRSRNSFNFLKSAFNVSRRLP